MIRRGLPAVDPIVPNMIDAPQEEFFFLSINEMIAEFGL